MVRINSFSSHYWIRSGQISDPISLIAGNRYYVRVRHREIGGNDFFYVACGIHVYDRIPTHFEMAHSSIREQQAIAFSTIVTREEHTVTVIGASGGSFVFQEGTKTSRRVDWTSTIGHVSAAIRDVSTCNSISSFITDDTDGDGNYVRIYRFRYSCPTNTPFPLPRIVETFSARLAGKNASFNIDSKRVVEASKPLRGTFRVGYDGLWTNWLSWDATSTEIVNQLMEHTALINIKGRQSGNGQDNKRVTITFYNPSGRMQELMLDDSRLEGTNASMSLQMVQEGSYDLFMDPIPGEYFQRAYEHNISSVRVLVDGIPSACTGTSTSVNDCSFTYDDSLTPIINDIRPYSHIVYDGDIIEISGERLARIDSKENHHDLEGTFVTFSQDGPSCVVIFVNSTLLRCIAGHASSGTHQIEVVVLGRGRARHMGNMSTITYGFRIDSIEPNEGGIMGGTAVAITGTGFSYLGDDVITIGGRVATVIIAEHDRFLCEVPRLSLDDPSETYDNAKAYTNGITTSVNVSFNGHLILNISYSYLWDMTPILESIFPTQVSSGHSSEILLDGIFIPTSELSQNESICPTMHGASITIEFPGHRFCSNIAMNVNGTHISCVLIRGDALMFSQQQYQIPTVRFCTSRGIFVSRPEPNVTIDIASRVSHVTPALVGLGGGADITIFGQGFGSRVDSVGVLLKANSNESIKTQSIPCQVYSVSNERVQCILEPTDIEVEEGVLELQVNGFVARCDIHHDNNVCRIQVLGYVTPVVTAIQNFIGGAGTTLQIVGHGFHSDLHQPSNETLSIRIELGEDSRGYGCSLLFFNDTHIQCEVPQMVAGRYQIKIFLDPIGQAVFNFTNEAVFSETTPYFIYPLSLWMMEPRSGSTAGGTHSTLFGDGFSPYDIDENQVFINDIRAIVLNATYNTVTFVIPGLSDEYPPEKVSAALSINVTSVYKSNPNLTDMFSLNFEKDSSTCNMTALCSFMYDPSLSGEITSITPSYGTMNGSTTFHIEGTGLLGDGSNPSQIIVEVGSSPCIIDEETATSSGLVCTVNSIPAGEHVVIVASQPNGVVRGKQTVYSDLGVDYVSSSPVSFGGGTPVSIHGHGFFTESHTLVHVCGKPCPIQTANYSTIVCLAPTISTPSSYATLNNVEMSRFQGILSGGSSVENIFDGDYDTFFSSSSNQRSTCAVLLDLGQTRRGRLHRIRVFPRIRYVNRAIGGKFYVSSNGTEYVHVATLQQGLTEGWSVIDVDHIEFVRFLRYNGPSGGYCNVAELEYIGVLVDTTDEIPCPVMVGVRPPTPHPSYGFRTRADNLDQLSSLITPEVHIVLDSSITFAYDLSVTPVVTNIEPAFGSSLGGTLVTLTGQYLSSGGSEVSNTFVLLNGYPCITQFVSNDGTEIRCVTTRRSELNKLSVAVTTGKGHKAVAAPSVRFRYLDRWSELTTWQNNEPPMDGDTVVIPPDQVVLLDISPPRLFLFLVQGELVFDRQDGLELHASYIWVQGGKFEIGTEAEPFLNRATITLYGDRWNSVSIPHLGAKVFAVSDNGHDSAHHRGEGHQLSFRDKGVLDIHGRPRLRTWTKVAETVHAGDTRIVLAEQVDFEPGEVIFLTHESNMHFTEELIVAGLEDNDRTVILRDPVVHTHVSQVLSIENHDVDMRVQVGLISRNIVIQGEPGKSEAQAFGSHLIAAHGGILRLENAELRRCGQAGVLGRYCSHFHIAGSNERSYIRSNSIHHSFQRAVTVHATHNSLVQNNVAYRVKGHTYFVEDGNERYNVIEANLGVYTEKLFIMLRSDTKPATFWMASPTNIWRHNVAAGCDNDGFWFEPFSHPRGPSFTTTICPTHEHMIEFLNNTAHANRVHGLRIYPVYLPRIDPCDPHSGPMPQYFYNFTAFLNGNNGIFGKNNGDLHHVNTKLIDNGREELSWKIMETVEYRENDPHIFNSLFVNSIPGVSHGSSHVGIMMPQNEFFHVNGATFVNYGNHGAIAGCSECDSDNNMKQGGFTYRLAGLRFVDSERFISWTEPRKQIFHDLDGSLTGFVNGTATPFYGWNLYPGTCEKAGIAHDFGIVCDGSVRVRRLQIDGVQPRELDFVRMHIGQFNHSERNDTIAFRPREFYGWAVPIVNQNSYFTSFVSLVDFRQMQIRYSEPQYLEGSTEFLELVWNYTDYRWAFDVQYANGDERHSVSLIDTLGANDPFGTGKIDHNNKNWHVVLSTSGVDRTVPGGAGFGGPFRLSASAIQCAPGSCNDLFSTDPLYEPSLWSDLTYWCYEEESQTASYGRFGDGYDFCAGYPKLPGEGDNVVINSRMYVIMNVNPPKLRQLQIIGKLEFRDNANRILWADTIEVWGTLQVGTRGRPFAHKATIKLSGERTSETLILHNSRFLGNKVMAVLGDLQLHGQQPSHAWTRLESTAEKDGILLHLQESVDWVVGDRIVISSTEYDASYYETGIIQSVTPDHRTLTLSQPLLHRHFAGDVSSGRGDISLRAVVGKLNRNIRFEGATGANEGNNYGAHIVVMDAAFEQGIRVGHSSLTNTEFHHCGKEATEHGCILYEYDQTYSEQDQPVNQVEWSTFSDSNKYGVISKGSHGILLRNNVIHRTKRNAIHLDSRTVRAQLRFNFVVGNQRSPDAPENWIQTHAAFFANTQSVHLEGNVASGCEDVGFLIRAETCAISTPTIIDNEAHGILIGAFIVAESRGCLQLTSFKVWKAAHVGILTVDQRSSLELHHVVVADSHIGISANFFNPSLHVRLDVISSVIMGTTDASTCTASLRCRAMISQDVDATSSTCHSVFGNRYRRVGILVPQVTNRGKTCGQDFLSQCRPITTPERLCSMSWERRYGTVGTQHAIFNVLDTDFSHFKQLDCGLRSVAVSPNPTQRSYSPEQRFEGISWYETEDNARFYFAPTEIFDRQCRSNTCDALQLLLVHDIDGSFSPLATPGVVTSSINPGLVDGLSRCTPLTGLGAFHCHSMPLRAFTFENIDRDRGDRNIGPIKMERMLNVTHVDRTAFSVGPADDGCAMRFFFGQYPMIMEMGKVYRVNISNTLPNNARIRVHIFEASEKILIHMFVFKNNLALRVVRAGKTIDPIARIPTLEDPPGTNMFDGRNNFYLVLQGSNQAVERVYDIRTINTIQLNMTMSISVEEFHNNRENLITNLAILLDIPSHRIKIVNVRPVSRDVVRAASQRTRYAHDLFKKEETISPEGVDVEIEIIDANNGTVPVTDEDSDAQLDELNKVMETFSQVASSGTLRERLGQVGITVEAVSIQAPAGNGVSAQSSFSVPVTTTTTQSPTEDVNPGNKSPSMNQTVLIGICTAAAIFVLLLVIMATMFLKNRPGRRTKTPVILMEVEERSNPDNTVAHSLKDLDSMSNDVSVAPNLRKGKEPVFDLADDLAVEELETPQRNNVFSRFIQSIRRASLTSKNDIINSKKSGNGISIKSCETLTSSPNQSNQFMTEAAANIVGPTLAERVQELHKGQCKVIDGLTWEYVRMHDWYHPTIGSDAAQRVLRNKDLGTFLVYGRLHCFLCVKSASSIIRHDAIEHIKEKGYRLHLGDIEQPWFNDLASLISYYQQPRERVPFVLRKESDNDVHFSVPLSTSHKTCCEDEHFESPRYNHEDLMRLSRKISLRVQKHRIHLSRQTVFSNSKPHENQLEESDFTTTGSNGTRIDIL